MTGSVVLVGTGIGSAAAGARRIRGARSCPARTVERVDVGHVRWWSSRPTRARRGVRRSWRRCWGATSVCGSVHLMVDNPRKMRNGPAVPYSLSGTPRLRAESGPGGFRVPVGAEMPLDVKRYIVIVVVIDFGRRAWLTPHLAAENEGTRRGSATRFSRARVSTGPAWGRTRRSARRSRRATYARL